MSSNDPVLIEDITPTHHLSNSHKFRLLEGVRHATRPKFRLFDTLTTQPDTRGQGEDTPPTRDQKEFELLFFQAF